MIMSVYRTFPVGRPCSVTVAVVLEPSYCTAGELSVASVSAEMLFVATTPASNASIVTWASSASLTLSTSPGSGVAPATVPPRSLTVPRAEFRTGLALPSTRVSDALRWNSRSRVSSTIRVDAPASMRPSCST